MSGIVVFLECERWRCGDYDYWYMGTSQGDEKIAQDFPEAECAEVYGFTETVRVKSKVYFDKKLVYENGELVYDVVDGVQIPRTDFVTRYEKMSPPLDWHETGTNHQESKTGEHTTYTKDVLKHIWCIRFDDLIVFAKWITDNGGELSDFDYKHEFGDIPSYTIKVTV